MENLGPHSHSRIDGRTKLMIDKVVNSIDEAIEGIEPGASLAIGGFGICGNPLVLITAIAERNIGDLEVYSNNPGTQVTGDSLGLAKFSEKHLMRKFGGSYVGFNIEFERQYLNGEIEVELIPQGTLAERMRAGGAGIPGFFTATGTDTQVANGGLPVRFNPDGSIAEASEPKEVRRMEFRGEERDFVFERAITTDFSLVRARKADRAGNLCFNLTAQNFNYDAAMCGKTVIVEVEELVEVGELGPNEIHLAGIYVDRIYVLTPEEVADKPIEIIRTREEESEDGGSSETGLREDGVGWNRIGIGRRAAQELRDGEYVNLGVGIPTEAASHVPDGVQVVLHGENGVLHLGPYPTPSEVNADLINPGKATTTIKPGGSTFSSSASFAMIRGGHINTAILGAFQVSENGDIANWGIPGRKMNGMGGAMDLVKGAQRVIAVLEHTEKNGTPRLLEECTYPLTAAGVVERIITSAGVFDVTDDGLLLIEVAPGVTLEDIAAKTKAKYRVSDDLIFHSA